MAGARSVRARAAAPRAASLDPAGVRGSGRGRGARRAARGGVMEGAHGEAGFLTDAVPLLGFALIFVLLFRKLGLGATLGYLVAGALVGPQLLGLVGDAESKMGIAELGIALLLFL